MTRRLIIRPEAEADIAGAALWYDDRERGLGDKVLNEIRAAIERALARYCWDRRRPRLPTIAYSNTSTTLIPKNHLTRKSISRLPIIWFS